ncbi:MAG: DUF3108 domain-containing protein [Devosia sp.]
MLTLVAGLWASASLAQEVAAKAAYVVTLGGNTVATASITLKDAENRYTLALDATVSGIGQFVAAGGAKASANGRSTASGLAAEKFDISTRSGRDMINATVAYTGGTVSTFVVEPPMINTIDRVPIERRHLNGVGDMLSAFLLRGKALDASLCNHKAQVFNGLERFNIALRFGRTDTATSRRTGYQGPVVVCLIDYTPVSGHYTSSEVTSFLADNDRMMIWYAPLRDTGYFIPYRVLIDTAYGDLSMVLTELG